jgi:hypothetical protein
VAGWLTAYFSGGVAYNATVFLVSAVGVLLAIWALYIAFGQLRRITIAAVAAKEAADSSRARVLAVTGLMSLTELCAFARDVQASIRLGSYEAAALRASDLRSGVRRGHGSRLGSDGDDDPRWGQLVSRIVSLHEALDRSARRESTPLDHERLTKLVNKVVDTLNDILAEMASELGET